MLTSKIKAVTVYLNNLKPKGLFMFDKIQERFTPIEKGLTSKLKGLKANEYRPIKNIIYLFGLGIILLIALTLFINRLFEIPVNHIQVYRNNLDSINSSILQLQVIKSNFLLNYPSEDNFFASDNNRFENQVREININLRNQVETLQELSWIKNKSDVSESVQAFSTSLTAYLNNLNDLFLAIRERGNSSSGIIFRWQNISNRMLLASKSSDGQIISDLEAIKNLETSYLLDNQPGIINEISSKVEEIRNAIPLTQSNIQLSDLDDYLATTSSLLAVDKRIGSIRTDGIMYQVERSLNDLLNNYNYIETRVGSRIKTVQNYWILSGYLVMALLAFALFYLLIRISNRLIVSPLTALTSFSAKLSMGTTPDEEIVTHSRHEPRAIAKNLNLFVSGLKDKFSFARSLNEGNFDVKLALLSESDTLGSELLILQKKIVENAREQTQYTEENTRRRYINDGLAQFAETLRSKSNDISALGDAFIRELVKYLNAIQGGFFLLDESDKNNPVLTLTSSFAYNRKKYLQKNLNLGSGLVGTCALEKKTIHLTEIPQDYMLITSGLGDTSPDNLLLIPITYENSLIGVLEIASLNKFKDFEITFAEEVAKSLGATIVTTRINEQTAQLLSKSQQQALEMAEQEEEMRQNMEELKATQEESARREEEFRGMVDAIGNVFYVVEYDLDGVIRNVNEKFCRFLGKPREELLGKKHAEVFNPNTTLNAIFWHEVEEQRIKTLTEKVKIARKEYRLFEQFAPVLNREGTAVKYVNFCWDITESKQSNN